MIDQIVLLTMFLPASIAIVLAFKQSKRIRINEPMTQECFTVMFPEVLVTICVFGDILIAIIFCGFAVFEPETADWISSIVFGLFFWLGAYLIILCKTFKVVVKNNEITVHKTFRKPYTITFSDITSAVREVSKDRLKTEEIMIKTSTGKRFTIVDLEISFEKFKKKIQEKVNKKYLSGFED